MRARTMRITLRGNTYSVTHKWGKYSNGRWALEFFCVTTGEPIVRASVNLVGIKMDADEMALNHDYAEDLITELQRLHFTTNEQRYVKPEDSFCEFTVVKIDPASQLC